MEVICIQTLHWYASTRQRCLLVWTRSSIWLRVSFLAQVPNYSETKVSRNFSLQMCYRNVYWKCSTHCNVNYVVGIIRGASWVSLWLASCFLVLHNTDVLINITQECYEPPSSECLSHSVNRREIRLTNALGKKRVIETMNVICWLARVSALVY